MRKTIEYQEFRRLCVCNSDKIPIVSIAGQRKRWVGIGLTDEGPEKGDEVVVVENEIVPPNPTKHKGRRKA